MHSSKRETTSSCASLGTPWQSPHPNALLAETSCVKMTDVPRFLSFLVGLMASARETLEARVSSLGARQFPKRLLRDHLGLQHAAMALVPMRRAPVRPLGRQLPRPSHAEQRGQLVEDGEFFQGLDGDCLGGTLRRGRLHHEHHGLGPADHRPRDNRHQLHARPVMGRTEDAAKVALASGGHHIGGEVCLLAPWANRLLLDGVVCVQGYDVLGSVLLCHDRRAEGGPLLREPAARDLLLVQDI